MILITGDFKASSAQGSRYQALFNDIQTTLLTYSKLSDSLDNCKHVVVSNINHRTLHIFICKLLRRLIYPDAYIFILKKYKIKLKELLDSGLEKNLVLGCTPFSLLLLASWIKKKYPSVNLIADLSDPFSFNMGNKRKPVHVAIANLIERIGFSHIDQLVVLNESIRDKYSEMYPMWAHKFTVIEQGVDEEFIKAVRDWTRHVSSSKTYSFLYAGGFYRIGRNPRGLYNAFAETRECCMLIVYGNIKRELRPNCVDNVEYHKAIDKKNLAKVTAVADALVLIDNDYGFQVPGKTIETLASGKPVLFIYKNVESPTCKYVRETKGVVWALNNSDAIATGIMRIVNGKYETTTFDYKLYTWNRMLEKYETVFKGRRD